MATYHVNVQTKLEMDVYVDADDEEDAEELVRDGFDFGTYVWPRQVYMTSTPTGPRCHGVEPSFRHPDDDYFVEAVEEG